MVQQNERSGVKMEQWSIYKHTFLDGKVYIGKTMKNPEERWGKLGRGYQGQPIIFDAILAYGWNNIKHEIIFSGLTEREAYLKEQELIRLSCEEGQNGNYNVQFSKRGEKQSTKALTRNETIITEDSLKQYGKYILHLPDIYYDRAMEKNGVSPFGVALEKDRATFEIWRSVNGGYEYSQNEAMYPHENMTFGDAEKWLTDNGEIGNTVKISFFSDDNIEKFTEEMKRMCS